MHDFGKIVYLDLQKTGSTYVSRFLNEACTLPLVREIKHGRIEGGRNPDAFHFITIRHPLAQYRSLYRYGLDGRGGLFARLDAAGHGGLYRDSTQAFNDWLIFLLDPAHAGLLGEDHAATAKRFDLGFLSHRFAMLALADPLKTLRRLRWRWNKDAAIRSALIVDLVIRQEALKEGLSELAHVLRPDCFDQARARAFLGADQSVNASVKGEGTALVPDPDVEARLRHRERLLFGYYEG